MKYLTSISIKHSSVIVKGEFYIFRDACCRGRIPQQKSDPEGPLVLFDQMEVSSFAE